MFAASLHTADAVLAAASESIPEQSLIAIACVLLALVYLVRRALRNHRSGRTSCGTSCSGCAPTAPANPPANQHPRIAPDSDLN